MKSLVLTALCVFLGFFSEAQTLQTKPEIGIKCPNCKGRENAKPLVWEHFTSGRGRFESLQNDSTTYEIDWELLKIEIGGSEYYSIQFKHSFTPSNHINIWFKDKTLSIYYDELGRYTHHLLF